MAEKRMFTMKIVDSDAFLDMPLSAQALYFHLNMRADDDGFISNPKKILRMIAGSEDDLKLLIAKRFVLVFENGVIVIKHWRMHNLLRKDRYNPTVYQEQLETLTIKENGSYTERGDELATICQPSGNHLATQDRLGKDRLDKDSNSVGKTVKRFIPPTPEEVRAYCTERRNNVDADRFVDYYAARGWELTKGRKMKDWRAAIRTWERNGYSNARSGATGVKIDNSGTDVLDDIL